MSLVVARASRRIELVQLIGATKEWTTGELASLREHACLGAREVAARLGRSVGSVKAAAYRHRISLRRSGSRRGLILGQPRGVSLRAEVRNELVCGRRDELIERRARLDAEAQLCPACGIRPQRTNAGFCLACTLERQTAHYEELLADQEALRRAWAARQRRKAALDAMEAAP